MSRKRRAHWCAQHPPNVHGRPAGAALRVVRALRDPLMLVTSLKSNAELYVINTVRSGSRAGSPPTISLRSTHALLELVRQRPDCEPGVEGGGPGDPQPRQRVSGEQAQDEITGSQSTRAPQILFPERTALDCDTEAIGKSFNHLARLLLCGVQIRKPGSSARAPRPPDRMRAPHLPFVQLIASRRVKRNPERPRSGPSRTATAPHSASRWPPIQVHQPHAEDSPCAPKAPITGGGGLHQATCHQPANLGFTFEFEGHF
jgi:hypothetical protein